MCIKKSYFIGTDKCHSKWITKVISLYIAKVNHKAIVLFGQTTTVLIKLAEGIEWLLSYLW